MHKPLRFVYHFAVFLGTMALLGHAHLDVYALPTKFPSAYPFPQTPTLKAKLSALRAFKRMDLRPQWLPQYQGIRTRGLSKHSLNSSYFAAVDYEAKPDPGFLQAELLDMDPAKTSEWRGQYESRVKEEDRLQRAGLYTAEQSRSQAAGMSGLGQGMLEEVGKYKLSKVGMRATNLVKHNDVIKPVVAPVVIVAGIYLGRPVNIRLSGESRLSLRTDFRFKVGGMELVTPLGLGTFEFRPLVPQSRSAAGGTAVNFGEMMNFGRSIDFSQERYQFSLARGLPVWGLSSTVLYGSSSRAVVGSVSKQLTPNISFVVDSIHYLSSVDPDRDTEEKVRLKYDIHF